MPVADLGGARKGLGNPLNFVPRCLCPPAVRREAGIKIMGSMTIEPGQE